MPGKNFTKMSILFELPYWKDLKLPHNLDVMHIEKNICESLFRTLLNIDGKSKDTLKARKDLEDMNIRADLHLNDTGSSIEKHHAWYTLTRDEKLEFLQFLESICFPDGFAANISKGISKDGKITGLTTHDYHILIQRILPIGMRGFLHKDICDALLQLGSFFRQLCSKTLKLDILDKLEQQIVIVLCKLEMILPPAFFDISVHLAVHLPQQARLGGPVQYRWMFFIERFLGTLKGMVSNRAHPEGLIAEAYVMKECSTFCSMYLHGIETRFNRQERNFDGERQPLDRFSVFSTSFRAFGHRDDLMLTQDQYDSLSWYVLNNCEELQEYLYEHEDALLAEGADNIENRQREQFGSWLRQRVINLRNQGASLVSDCLYALAIGPHKRVHKFSGCIVGGVRFLTKEREEGRKSQNSGVCTEGQHKGQNITYYGILKNIYVLDYPNDRHVALFECEWYDLESNKPVRIDDDFVSVNIGSKWYQDDSFVLASQVSQVFYVRDTKLKGDWLVVQKAPHRHLFDPQVWNQVNEDDASEDIAFQEEEATNVSIDESFEGNVSCRHDVAPEIVTDPKELASLKESHVSQDNFEEEPE
ncbi:hypothetical protein ACQJBY_027972 [Aegilops geniculata]